jgi:hypothetical protein
MSEANGCEAFVGLASPQERSSVVLFLKGAVRTSNGGMILNVLPLTVDYAAQTITSLLGDQYEIEVQERTL